MEKKLSIKGICILLMFIYTVSSCEKIVAIDPPIDTITTEQVFSSNEQAEWALAGVYSRLINGDEVLRTTEKESFAAGLASMAGAFSADEFSPWEGKDNSPGWACAGNTLNIQNATYPFAIWNSAYKIIYDANAVIEGAAASAAVMFTDSARKQLIAEAKSIRAFCYFYLTNFFGDLPLALTIDYNKTKNISRSPQSVIYQQIIKDLTEASADLHPDFRAGKGQRIRFNKWTAEALLARVYLFTGQYQQAMNSATSVINQSDLFILEPDLNNVFLIESREAIWQLAHTTNIGDCAPETMIWLPPVGSIDHSNTLLPALVNSFELADKRRSDWILEFPPADLKPVVTWLPFKYKNRSTSGMRTEYSVVLRLAEMYLVRAEAAVLLNQGNTQPAIQDLNIIRRRAGLDDLSLSLNAQQVVQAVADERRHELFTEWAHRWFDLKRTGKATAVLSAIANKNPWRGDYQLLYPIPESERQRNIALTQNPGYERL